MLPGTSDGVYHTGRVSSIECWKGLTLARVCGYHGNSTRLSTNWCSLPLARPIETINQFVWLEG